jgi:hypothetical protein
MDQTFEDVSLDTSAGNPLLVSTILIDNNPFIARKKR